MNGTTDSALGGSDLRLLTAWCGRRDMSWSVADAALDGPAMALIPRDARRPWQSMLLVLHRGEIRLQNEMGETLASASDLPALLDAVDGGVAEPPSHARLLGSLAALPAATLLGYIF